jgi:RNA polymerase primary sigma factor
MVEDHTAVSPFDAAAATLLPGEVTRILATLGERVREILRLRFGLGQGQPRTPEEVCQRLHLTRDRIRQIEARTMSKLRASVNIDLREYLTD